MHARHHATSRQSRHPGSEGEQLHAFSFKTHGPRPVNRRAEVLDWLRGRARGLELSGKTVPVQCGYDFFGGSFGLIMVSLAKPGEFFKVANCDYWSVDKGRSSNERIIREARALRHLENIKLGGIPRFHSLGVNRGGAVWARMSSISGAQGLNTIWKKLHPVQFTEALIKAAQIHRDINNSGWLHGDAALRNILLNPAGEVAVIDFGNALKWPRPVPAEAGKLAESIRELILSFPQGVKPGYIDAYTKQLTGKLENENITWSELIAALEVAKKNFEADFRRPVSPPPARLESSFRLCDIQIEGGETKLVCDLLKDRIDYLDKGSFQLALDAAVGNIRSFDPQGVSVSCNLGRDCLVVRIIGRTKAFLPSGVECKELSAANLKSGVGTHFASYYEAARRIFDGVNKAFAGEFCFKSVPAVIWEHTRDRTGSKAVGMQIRVPLPLL